MNVEYNQLNDINNINCDVINDINALLKENLFLDEEKIETNGLTPDKIEEFAKSLSNDLKKGFGKDISAEQILNNPKKIYEVYKKINLFNTSLDNENEDILRNWWNHS